MLYRPYVKSISRHLRVRGGEYDLVILSRADAAVELMGEVRRYCPNARVVYDTVDLHFLREQRLAKLTGDTSTRRLAEYRQREELGLIALADCTLVVSPVERELLAKLAPGADVRVLSNIHRIPGRRTNYSDRRNIFFIGSFSHPPNVDAVLWFCRDILPHILVRLPELQFFIIGADPPAEVRALSSPSIRVLGHVPDLIPYLDGCRLSVAPLRYGAGVKGKVNQSMAHGLPVVGTSAAVEGMHLENGKSVLVADTPTEFSAAVVKLYMDSNLWERISRGGINVMEENFSFAVARKALVELFGS